MVMSVNPVKPQAVGTHANHNNEAVQAHTFRHELDHTKAVRTSTGAEAVESAKATQAPAAMLADRSQQAPANAETANPAFNGGKSDVELLNGQATNDPNFIQANGFIFFEAPPIFRFGPMGRYAPLGRGAPIEEAPVIRPTPPVRPNPQPVPPENMPPGTGPRPPVPLTGPTDSDKVTPKEGQPEVPEAKPEQVPQTKPDTPPPPKTEEKTECDNADGAGATVPPTPADINRLVVEHAEDKKSPPLTHAAANSIVAQTQPPDTEAIIVGKGGRGPDITYVDSCTKQTVDTVEVKSVLTRNGFNNELKVALRKKGKDQARVIAFQVDPNNVKSEDHDMSKWMARYWGPRKDANLTGWKVKAAAHANKEILIVDPNGKLLYRGPIFDPSKAQ